jgi:hypothetical protein
MKVLPTVLILVANTYAFELRQGLPTKSTALISPISTDAKMLSVVLSAPASLPTASSQLVRPSKPTIKTWAKRLNTKEDKFSLHKISGITFVVSSTLILGVGAMVGFHEVPEWLQVADAAVLGSTACQFFTSIGMALKHRRHQPKVRDQFLSMAATSMFMALSATLYTPFTPPFLCDTFTFDLIVIPLVLYSIYVPLSTANNPKSLLLEREKSREKSSMNNNYNNNFAMMVNYVASTIIPCVASAVLLYFLADPAHDREWTRNFANEHGGVAHFYYTIVWSNAATMYSALLLTLVDKKLVPRHWEYNQGTLLLVALIIPNVMIFF